MRRLHQGQRAWKGNSEAPELILAWRWEAEEKQLLRSWTQGQMKLNRESRSWEEESVGPQSSESHSGAREALRTDSPICKR